MQIHFEPFLHLAELTDERALIAWGGFYFRRADEHDAAWRIVDDTELEEFTGQARTETIGARSEPFGAAVVEVLDGERVVARAETAERNHAWLTGLEPDTEYRYRVVVDGEPWAEGERMDWDTDRQTLVASGRRYDNRFRTFPAGDAAEPVTFAVIGDFGIGILVKGEHGDRQLRLAGALERAAAAHDLRLVLTVGDNIYLGAEDSTSGTGNEDDDWYASFYEPYRFILNRVPFYPAVGNHDVGDTERSDDREQLADNYFLEHRFRPEVDSGRASLDPGLFYRFAVGATVEFVCIDTSYAAEMEVEHYFDDPGHLQWMRDALGGPADGQPAWRIPFSHHPPYCAGPDHDCTPGMIERVVPLYQAAGVRLVLSGHEHNFQHSVVDGIDYIISGAGGKLTEAPPRDFEAAGTRAWAAAGHFLLVEASAQRLLVHPVADVGPGGQIEAIEIVDPRGDPVATPLEIAATSRPAQAPSGGQGAED
jgi:hypothetical protein